MTEKRIDVVVRTGNSKDEIKDLDAAMKGLGASADKAGKELSDVSTGATKASGSIGKLTPVAAGVKTGIAGVGRVAGQAGIQVQQFIGQIQGGQNAMLALSAQAADLGLVLSAPLVGAIVGIGASVAGMLAPSLFNAKSGMEAYIEVAEKLDPVVTKNKSGIALLSEELMELAKISNSLARAKIAQALIDAEKAIEVSASGVKEVIEDLPRTIFINVKKISESFEATGGSVEKFGEKLKSLNVKGVPIGRISDLKQGLRAVERAFGLSTEQASRLAIAMGDVRREASQFNVQKLITTVEELGEETGHTSEGLIKFTNDLAPLIQGSADATDKINALKASMIDLPTAIQASESESGITAPSGEATSQDSEEQALRERLQMSHAFETAELEQHFTFLTMTEEQNAQFIAREDAMKEAKARRDMARAAMVAKFEEQRQLMKIQTARNVFGALGAINKAFFNDNKALNSGLIIADTAASAMSEYKKGGPAAAVAAVLYGAAQLKINNSAGQGSTAIPSSPSININESPRGQITQAPQEFNQLRAIDIRLDDDAVLTGAAVKELITGVLSTDEDVTLQITANQNQLQREGAI